MTGARTIALSAEQVARLRSERREFIEVQEMIAAFSPKGARCERCWSFFPDDQTIPDSCTTCGGELGELPPLWPPAALGMYCGAFVVKAVDGFDQVLEVRDGEEVLDAISRVSVEGR